MVQGREEKDGEYEQRELRYPWLAVIQPGNGDAHAGCVILGLARVVLPSHRRSELRQRRLFGLLARGEDVGMSCPDKCTGGNETALSYKQR